MAPRRWRFVLRQSLGLYHAQLLYGLAGSTPYCALAAPDAVLKVAVITIGPCERSGRGRGLIAFWPVATLPYWLRAHGIVLTSVRNAPPSIICKA